MSVKDFFEKRNVSLELFFNNPNVKSEIKEALVTITVVGVVGLVTFGVYTISRKITLLGVQDAIQKAVRSGNLELLTKKSSDLSNLGGLNLIRTLNEMNLPNRNWKKER